MTSKNYLQFQSFGNHEFDNGIEGLVPFVKNLTFPVVNCNIDVSREPRMQGLFNKSIIKTVGGEKIGIIGYLIEETSSISNPGVWLVHYLLICPLFLL